MQGILYKGGFRICGLGRFVRVRRPRGLGGARILWGKDVFGGFSGEVCRRWNG